MENNGTAKSLKFLYGIAAYGLLAASTAISFAQAPSKPAPAPASSPSPTVTASGDLPDAPVAQNVPFAPAPRRILLPVPSMEEDIKPPQEAAKPRRQYGKTCALDVIGRSWHFDIPPSIAMNVDNNNLGGMIKCGGTIQYFAGGYPGSNEGEPIVGAGVEYDRRFKLPHSTLVYGGVMAELLHGYPRKYKSGLPFYDPLSPFGATVVFGAEKKLPESLGRLVAKDFGQDFADHFSHCYAGPRFMYVPGGVSVLNLGGQLECNYIAKPKQDPEPSSDSKPHRSHFHWLGKLFGKHDHQ